MPPSGNSLSLNPQQELEIRRYESKMGFLKVLTGTCTVGLAGVIFPFVVQFYNASNEESRRKIELEILQQTNHQNYIKEFFQTAVNQDIELRIRFAEYFAALSGGKGKSQKENIGDGESKLKLEGWERYLSELKGKREKLREKINELEGNLIGATSGTPKEHKERERIKRELTWAYNEIGYVPLERTSIFKGNDELTKHSLYFETIEIIKSFTGDENVILGSSENHKRYWQLYYKDLIGVESKEVAKLMIEFGVELGRVVRKEANDKNKLKRLGGDVIKKMLQESRKREEEK